MLPARDSWHTPHYWLATCTLANSTLGTKKWESYRILAISAQQCRPASFKIWFSSFIRWIVCFLAKGPFCFVEIENCFVVLFGKGRVSTKVVWIARDHCSVRPLIYRAIVCTVDEAHCCDTSRSLWILIGQHSKATSSKSGCNPSLVSRLLYRSDYQYSYQLNLPVFLVSCKTGGLHTKYQILTHTWENQLSVRWSCTQRGQTSLYYSTDGSFWGFIKKKWKNWSRITVFNEPWLMLKCLVDFSIT